MLSDSLDLYMDYLRCSKLFKGLTEEEIEDFLNNNTYEIQELKKQDVVKIQLNKSIFVIYGTVASFENKSDGTKKFINIFRPEENVLIAVSKTTPYPTVSVEARKPSIVLLLETDSFLSVNPYLIMIQNKVQANIIEIFYDMTENVLKRTMINAGTSAKGRILEYIKQLNEEQGSKIVRTPFTRSELANHLLMDTSTLMRELKQMKKEGIIEYKRNKITITDTSLLS